MKWQWKNRIKLFEFLIYKCRVPSDQASSIIGVYLKYCDYLWKNVIQIFIGKCEILYKIFRWKFSFTVSRCRKLFQMIFVSRFAANESGERLMEIRKILATRVGGSRTRFFQNRFDSQQLFLLNLSKVNWRAICHVCYWFPPFHKWDGPFLECLTLCTWWFYDLLFIIEFIF